MSENERFFLPTAFQFSITSPLCHFIIAWTGHKAIWLKICGNIWECLKVCFESQEIFEFSEHWVVFLGFHYQKNLDYVSNNLRVCFKKLWLQFEWGIRKAVPNLYMWSKISRNIKSTYVKVSPATNLQPSMYASSCFNCGFNVLLQYSSRLSNGVLK